MSLSTRKPPGIPGSVRPPRSASTTRGREPASRFQDDSPLSFNSSDNKYPVFPQFGRSRSVPRQEADNPFRSRRGEEVPPVPPTPSRHSAQSSVSSSSSEGSMVSAASTAPSSIWDYVGRKTGVETSAGEQERIPSPVPVEPRAVQADSSTGFWSRVAIVAGGLGVNVAKAWEAKDDLPEPDTPPGRDSRVTTALKKHYIKQVSDPRQLPAWLFSDIERQVGRGHSRAESGPTSNYGGQSSPTYGDPAPTPARLRARRVDEYVQLRPVARAETMPTARREEALAGPTRAATRLRALRDAKRGPVEREVYFPRAPEPEPEPVEAAPLPRPRVGLPARPATARRNC